MNFVKPVETFLLQRFDVVDTNRLPLEVLYWFLVVGVAAFALHFIFRTLPQLLRPRG